MEEVNFSTTTNFAIKKFTYKWIINNIYWVYSLGGYKQLKSLHFPDHHEFKWQMNLVRSDRENLEILVHFKDPSQLENQYKIRITLEDCEKNSLLIYENNICGNSVVIPLKWSELFNNNNNNLIIYCTVYTLKSPEHYTQGFNKIQIPPSKLMENFAGLLNQRNFNDVQIETSGGDIIHANEFILAARSKVFAAMFEHPMEENKKKYININDFSREVIAEMLQFIYTDEAPNLEKLAEELIAAADKYGLDRLKAMCARCLINNLTTENAPLYLKLADLYNIEELRAETTKVINIFLREVVKTESWKSLITTDKDLLLDSVIDSQVYKLDLNNT